MERIGGLCGRQEVGGSWGAEVTLGVEADLGGGGGTPRRWGALGFGDIWGGGFWGLGPGGHQGWGVTGERGTPRGWGVWGVCGGGVLGAPRGGGRQWGGIEVWRRLKEVGGGR